MKNIGMARKVDQLGRIVLPIELRRIMELDEGDAIEFFIDEENKLVGFRKYRTQECLFCQSMEQLVFYRGQFVCASCMFDLSKADQKDVILEIAADIEVMDDPSLSPESPGLGRRHGQALSRLIEVMKSHPEATNGEWAKLVGVTPGRISQLLAKLGKSRSYRKRV